MSRSSFKSPKKSKNRERKEEKKMGPQIKVTDKPSSGTAKIKVTENKNRQQPAITVRKSKKGRNQKIRTVLEKTTKPNETNIKVGKTEGKEFISEILDRPKRMRSLYDYDFRDRVNDVPAIKYNNPGNIKDGKYTHHWVESGKAVISEKEALDGGHFLIFNNLGYGREAQKELFVSEVYSKKDLDSAFMKWSNGGYNAEHTGLDRRKTVGELSDDEIEQAIKTINIEEGFAKRIKELAPEIEKMVIKSDTKIASNLLSKSKQPQSKLEENIAYIEKALTEKQVIEDPNLKRSFETTLSQLKEQKQKDEEFGLSGVGELYQQAEVKKPKVDISEALGITPSQYGLSSKDYKVPKVKESNDFADLISDEGYEKYAAKRRGGTEGAYRRLQTELGIPERKRRITADLMDEDSPINRFIRESRERRAVEEEYSRIQDMGTYSTTLQLQEAVQKYMTEPKPETPTYAPEPQPQETVWQKLKNFIYSKPQPAQQPTMGLMGAPTVQAGIQQQPSLGQKLLNFMSSPAVKVAMPTTLPSTKLLEYMQKPQKAVEEVTDFARMFPRSFVSTGLSIAGEKERTPEDKFEQFFLGKEPIKNQKETMKEMLLGMGVKEKTAEKLSGPAGVIMAGLDLSTFGALGKQAVKATIKQEGKMSAEYIAKEFAAMKAAEAGTKPTMVQKLKDTVIATAKTLIDSTIPLTSPIEKSARKFKINIAESDNVQNHISKSIRAYQIGRNYIEKSGIEKVLQSIPNWKEFSLYLRNKQMIDVAGRGINVGRKNIRQDIIETAKVGNKYASQEKFLRDYTRGLLDYAVRQGLKSQEQAKTLLEKYPNYIPLNRIFTETEKQSTKGMTGTLAGLTKSRLDKKLVGSGRTIQESLENLINYTYDIVQEGIRNETAEKIVKTKEYLPNNPLGLEPLRLAKNVVKRIELLGTLKNTLKEQRVSVRGLKTNNKLVNKIFGKIDDTGEALEALADKAQTMASEFVARTKITPIINKAITQEKKLYKLQGDALVNSKAREKLLGVINQRKETIAAIKEHIRSMQDVKKKYGEETISYLKDGVREVWKINNDAARAFKQLDVYNIGLASQILAAPIRLFKTGTTGILAPKFLVKNLGVDQLMAFIISRNSLRGSVANPVNFTKALWQTLGHGDDYKKIIEYGGGGTSFDYWRNPGKMTLEEILAGRSLGSKIKYYAKNPMQFWRKLEDIASRSEELTRMQYGLAAKAGKIGEEANYAAANAFRTTTVDFLRQGEMGPIIKALYSYLNPSIQGTRTFIRAMAERPAETTLKVVGSIFLPIAAVTAYNLKDPKRREAYLDTQEYEKEGSLVYFPDNPTKDENNEWNAIKVPIPPDVISSSKLIRKMVEENYNVDKVRFMDFANALMGTITPIEPNQQSILSNIVPQLPRAPMEAISNFNYFTGLPIVPESEQNLPKEMQFGDRTTATAKFLGEKLGQSTRVIEHLLKGVFGGAAQQGLHYADVGMSKAGVIKPEEIKGVGEIEAITSRFTKARGGASENKEIEGIKELIMGQAGEKKKLKQEAEELYKKYVPEGEKPTKFKIEASKIERSNPGLAEQMKNLITEKEKDLTVTEKFILQLGVNNGERAKYIYEKAKNMNKKERNAYLDNLKEKKVITKEVYYQIMKLKK